mgnify:FL=1
MKIVKVEWCENFIKAKFKKCAGIEVGCFWEMAAASGLWEYGTYGTSMSEALDKLVKVEMVYAASGNYGYTVFRLA